MDDVRRQDLRLFLVELISPLRVVLTFVALMLVVPALGRVPVAGALGMILILFIAGMTAWSDSIRNRWLNKRMRALWNGCQDRMSRFEEVFKKMRREQVADLREMPQTIRGVSAALYLALRRADIIAHEVQQSEKDLYNQPPVWHSPGSDAQSQELYRLADRNIAEYRAQFEGVMAGVKRTEAQSAVFMTTLDTLRMKMIGYRLVGRSPEMSSHDFLEALAEARAQLQSIDTALEELDLGHYPKQISVVPPAIPEEIRQLEQNG